MSDDEYQYDSPYEDLTDILWDIDTAPDLADDLAEHSMHSPIWQDNPVEELRDYHSDWEYYSDDYYDDDPSTLQNTAARDVGDKTAASRTQRRGRKRKIAEVHEEDPLRACENRALVRSLRGTVWAAGRSCTTNKYRLGEQPKVALHLSNRVMHAAYNKKRGFGQATLNRDESWANDLSLADMGLQTKLSVPRHEDPDGDVEEEEREHQARLGSGQFGVSDESEVNVELEPVNVGESLAASQITIPRPKPDLCSYEVVGVGERQDTEATGPLYKKRLKALVASKEPSQSNSLHQSITLPPEKPSETDDQVQTDQAQPSAPQRHAKLHTGGAESVDGTGKVHPRGQKRKVPLEASVTTSITGNRAKRVALDSQHTDARQDR